MIKRNRQRNITYFMPLKKDITRFYLNLKRQKLNFFGWTKLNGYRT